MKKNSFPLFLLVLAIISVTQQAGAENSVPSGAWRDHVKGIGGIFFKVNDPDKVRSWYQEHMGIDAVEAGYSYFLWRSHQEQDQVNRTVWSVFPRDSEYFGNSGQQYMINYIVTDLDGFLMKLKSNGIEQVAELAEYPYGRFAWINDVEGNRIELWEAPGSAEQ